MTFNHELKMCRARKHLMELNAEVRARLDGNYHSVRYEFDCDARWEGPIPVGPTVADGVDFGRGVVTALVSAEQPPDDPISLLIGDALHNLRSALDALAYTLAIAYSKPLPKEVAESSEFPIFGDEGRHGTTGVGSDLFHRKSGNGSPARGSGLFKIRGWHPDAQTVVEALQPYKRGNDFRPHPLWVLHELDRINKHRLVHATVAAFEGAFWDVHRSRGVVIGPGRVESFAGTVETDTPVARIYGIRPTGPDAQMHVDIVPALDVAFSSDAPVAAGEPVQRTLDTIYAYVIDEVIPRLAPFL